jgi:hypothetical protein
MKFADGAEEKKSKDCTTYGSTNDDNDAILLRQAPRKMEVGCAGLVVTKGNVHDKEWEGQMNVVVVAKAGLKVKQTMPTTKETTANDERTLTLAVGTFRKKCPWIK